MDVRRRGSPIDTLIDNNIIGAHPNIDHLFLHHRPIAY
jgi:hypothetical protein